MLTRTEPVVELVAKPGLPARRRKAAGHVRGTEASALLKRCGPQLRCLVPISVVLKLFAGFLLLWPPLSAFAQVPAASADGFVRITRNEVRVPLSLDTSVRTYEVTNGPFQGARVALIGAVHVADPEYYATLNNEFSKYDAVLYELIAPEQKDIPVDRAELNVVSGMQIAIKQLLGLSFQLEEVDYTRANMVHADLSTEAFLKSLSDRGESMWSLFGKMILAGFAQENEKADPIRDMMTLLRLVSGNTEEQKFAIRKYMASQFENIDELVKSLEGNEGSVIVAERNKKALEVLSSVLAKGKRNIGIFYGAAHMADMSNRLHQQLSVKTVDERWLPAWSLTPHVATAAPKEAGDGTTSPAVSGRAAG